MDAIDKVILTLQASDKPLKAGEIAQSANLDKKEVDLAMKALKADGRITSPKRCFWTVS